MNAVLTVKDRVLRVFGRVQRGQLAAGMLLAAERVALSATKYDRLIADVFQYQTKTTGKTTTKWHVPKSSVGRWVNAGAVALVLGFTLDDDDDNPDLPPMGVLAPLYAILKTGKDLEDGEALDAIHQAVREAWTTANEVFAEGKTKTLLLAVEAEVARRTKKKKKTTTTTPNTPTDGPSDGENVVEYDMSAVIAVRPTMDAWVKKTSADLRVSQKNVRLIGMDLLRFASEHGPATVQMALAPDLSEDGESK